MSITAAPKERKIKRRKTEPTPLDDCTLRDAQHTHLNSEGMRAIVTIRSTYKKLVESKGDCLRWVWTL